VFCSPLSDMDAMQVRELMFTTANNKMTDGVRFLGTGQPPLRGIHRLDRSRRSSGHAGAGDSHLEKGMYGPGQS